MTLSSQDTQCGPPTRVQRARPRKHSHTKKSTKNVELGDDPCRLENAVQAVESGMLFVQPGSESAAALEATAQDKFQLFGGRVVFEFDAAKNQMILKRGGRSIVFTKEK